MSTHQNLSQLAIEVVGRCQPCSPYTLINSLKEAGASTAVANRTMLELIRDGHLSRTLDGQLVVPGFRAKASVGRVVTLVVFLAVIIGFMAWVFMNLLNR